MKYPDVTAGQVEACINRLGGWGRFLLYIGGKGKIVFDQPLTFICSALMSAQPAVKLTFDYICNGLQHHGQHSEEFKGQFYDLVSPKSKETKIVIHKLEEETLNSYILKELGEKAEINPLQFLVFLKGHENSGSWHTFVAFIRGKDGNLWVVKSAAQSYFYNLVAEPVGSIYVIDEGSYIISRE